MNKYIKGILISALIISPILVFGASQVVKNYKQWDFFAQIEQTKYGNLYFYKIDDPSDPNIKCYVMSNDGSKYGEGIGISCVNVSVKK